MAKNVRGKKIGRFELVEHLASGGMAEIYLGRQASEGGFSKHLVLKILQDRYEDNAEVVAMYQQEARLGALLNHPSIVDVFDAGVDGNKRYIAMEHIPGRTLTELVLRALEVSRPLPLSFSAFIIAQVAEALDYMQEGRDAEGRPLRVVHRDVSPTNIIVGESGLTKLIDFGVATQGDKGVGSSAIAGKTGYMSPEQAQGLALDGRSDIFCLGTILYEITVGRRLWRGGKETVLPRLVEAQVPPPTSVVRDYPPLLELIVMKALSRRPESRYAHAADMASDLMAFVVESGAFVSHRHLAEFLRVIYAPESKKSEKGIQRAQAFLEGGDVVVDTEAAPLDFDQAGAGAAGAVLARALRESGPLRILPAALRGSPPAEALPEGATEPSPAVPAEPAAPVLSTPASPVEAGITPAPPIPDIAAVPAGSGAAKPLMWLLLGALIGVAGMLLLR